MVQLLFWLRFNLPENKTSSGSRISQTESTVSTPRVTAKCYRYLVTVRKRSLTLGNVFTSVCQSFCSQVGLVSQHASQVRRPGVCIHGDSAFRGSSSMEGVGRPPGRAYRVIRRAFPQIYTWDTMGYGQQAVGTHPTGTHSRVWTTF